MKPNYLFTALLISSIISCANQDMRKIELFSALPSFDVKIENFDGSLGEARKWHITRDSIKLIFSCDTEGCKNRLMISKSIDSTLAKLYYNNLIQIPLYKLKKEYDNTLVSDGLQLRVKVSKVYKKEINIYLHATVKQEIEELCKLTDSILLKGSKFKILGNE